MEEPPLNHILIAVQWTVVGIIGVGGDENVVRPGDGANRYNYRRMGEHFPAVFKPKLDKVTRA